MSPWQDALALIASNVEETYDALRDRLGERLMCSRPLLIVPYRSYGTAGRLLVRGRVLQNKGVMSPRDTDTTWDNLLNMYRRFNSSEVPYARIRATYRGVSQEIVADEEGFFAAWLELPPAQAGGPGAGGPGSTDLAGEMGTVEAGGLWREVSLDLLEPECEDGSPVSTSCFVLQPPDTAQFGVISDIDDTVVRTDVGQLWKMARTVFLGNARIRLPFEGVAAFYRALYEGGGSEPKYNPLFYVSNSPWNMYDLFSDFFQMQDIPVGPVLILRDWGISRPKKPAGPLHARAFKLETVRQIMDLYQHLPFILIGDSGEKDPEVYQQIVTDYPGRVLAVYIRNVSRKPARIGAINALAEKLLAAGSTLILADNTLPLAQHAVNQGWISASALPRIREAKAADQAPAGPLEKILGEPAQKPGPTVVVTNPEPAEGAISDALKAGDAAGQKAPTVVVKGDEAEKGEGGESSS